MMTMKKITIGLALLALTFFLVSCFGGGSLDVPGDTGGDTSGTGEQNMMVPQVQLPGPYVPDEILVKFKEGVLPERIQQILQAQGAAVKVWAGEQYLERLGILLLKIPDGAVESQVSAFRQFADTDFAEPNAYNFMVFNPDDFYFYKEWGMNNTGQATSGFGAGTNDVDIDAPEAWTLVGGGSAATHIAIVDCGVDSDHPELGPKIVGANDSTGSATGSQDICGHGTHVAGIAAASGNNKRGVAGVCWLCDLLNSKALGDNGSGTTAALAAAFSWADASYPAFPTRLVMNASIGYPAGTACPGTVAAAINTAWGNGRIIVVAAGNSNTSVSTALRNCANTFAVAATDNTDARAGFSDFGSEVDIAAPGVAIYSTLPNHANNMGPRNYGYLQGTSMSSPMVAGSAALVWDVYPALTNQGVLDRLCLRAENIPGTIRTGNTGVGSFWNCGRLNLFEALK